jgi:molybdate transport system substrate-binding protein
LHPKLSHFLLISFLSVLVLAGLSGCSADKKTTLYVSAGVGLTNAITEINQLYMQINDETEVISNFAAAGDLRIQIENGAPTDIFISAAAREMNILEEKGLILAETRHNIVGNSLVLIVHRDSSLNISGFADLSGKKVKLIAMGDPEFVPAGYYGLLTFEQLDIPFDELEPKIILGNNVRQVLNYVENKSVDAGIVYSTDALISEYVKIICSAPFEINQEIVFPAAVIASSKNIAAAISYNDFLSSMEATTIFKQHGYRLIAADH